MTNEEKDRLIAEIWKPTPFDGYEASNLGRIRSWRHKNGRRKKPHILYQCKAPTGYMIVRFMHQGREIGTCVHRLVLMAFRGLPLSNQESAHNDGNRTNNHIDNLRWATRKENNADKRKHGTLLLGEQANSAKLTREDVMKIRYLSRSGMTGKDIAMRFGIVTSTACRIINRKTWNHV